MSRPKSKRIGPVVVTRYSTGACTVACNRSDCGVYRQPRSWRAGLRQARSHVAAHDAMDAPFVGTPWGIPAHELSRAARRRLRGR
jgi:hypothetical protein